MNITHIRIYINFIIRSKAKLFFATQSICNLSSYICLCLFVIWSKTWSIKIHNYYNNFIIDNKFFSLSVGRRLSLSKKKNASLSNYFLFWIWHILLLLYNKNNIEQIDQTHKHTNIIYIYKLWLLNWIYMPVGHSHSRSVHSILYIYIIHGFTVINFSPQRRTKHTFVFNMFQHIINNLTKYSGTI